MCVCCSERDHPDESMPPSQCYQLLHLLCSQGGAVAGDEAHVWRYLIPNSCISHSCHGFLMHPQPPYYMHLHEYQCKMTSHCVLVAGGHYLSQHFLCPKGVAIQCSVCITGREGGNSHVEQLFKGLPSLQMGVYLSLQQDQISTIFFRSHCHNA